MEVSHSVTASAALAMYSPMTSCSGNTAAQSWIARQMMAMRVTMPATIKPMRRRIKGRTFGWYFTAVLDGGGS